jgi:hypothetical protein
MKLLWSGVLASVGLIGFSMEARAGFVTDTLGAAGPSNYALLALSTSPGVQIAGANNQPPLPGGGVAGNVGITNGSTISLSNPASITGNLYVANSANQFNNSGALGGAVIAGGAGPNGTTLSQANSAATAASATFAALAPTITGIGQVNGTTQINGTAGTNVVNLSSIKLGNGQSLTLNGPAGSQFVVNVGTGGITMNGPASISLTGGLTPSDVVFNLPNGGTVSTSGGLTNNLSVINGIVLDPTSNGKFQLTPGLVNGEIIGGGQIALASGATIAGPPMNNVPVPPSFVVMGLGGVFMAWAARSRRRPAALPHA